MLFNKEAIQQHRIHFIGIGGIGMSGIAEILLNLGYTVTGSDLRDSPVTERLRRLGATIQIGHSAANLGDAQAVVASSAIAENNLELVEARRTRIPAISRGNCWLSSCGSNLALQLPEATGRHPHRRCVRPCSALVGRTRQS